MLQSKLFTKIKKEFPADENSKNAKLLLRAGYIEKEMSGVYTFLPLGLMVLNNIIEVIRREMNQLDAQEISLSGLQDLELWKKTNRDPGNKDIDAWFTTKLKNETELGLGFTHEEPITNMMTHFIKSYKDLPVLAYQFQTKFRNETRAKSGIMRTREFIMKDLYSFASDQEEHDKIYERVALSYKNIFEKLGLGNITYKTFASGGVFSKYSHEFQTVSEEGEDKIYISEIKNIAINEEVLNDEVLKDLKISRDELIQKKAVEVGNIFNLSTRFSEAFNLKYKTQDGTEKFVIMGSYGIGPARLMGVIVETLSDEKGIYWPEIIAPFSLHLISLAKEQDEESFKLAKDIYDKLKLNQVEVLFDDRFDKSAGEKFTESDLLGIPMRVVISAKSLVLGGIELKYRKSSDVEIISVEKLLHMYGNSC